MVAANGFIGVNEFIVADQEGLLYMKERPEGERLEV
jgi:hypothetical protein